MTHNSDITPFETGSYLRETTFEVRKCKSTGVSWGHRVPSSDLLLFFTITNHKLKTQASPSRTIKEERKTHTCCSKTSQIHFKPKDLGSASLSSGALTSSQRLSTPDLCASVCIYVCACVCHCVAQHKASCLVSG